MVKNQFSSQIFPKYKCKKRLPQLWNILLSNKNVTSRVHERNFHSEFDKYLHFPIHIPLGGERPASAAHLVSMSTGNRN